MSWLIIRIGKNFLIPEFIISGYIIIFDKKFK